MGDDPEGGLGEPPDEADESDGEFDGDVASSGD